VQTKGIFAPDARFEERRILTLEELADKAVHLRGLGYKIVLTSGSFDMLHIGHMLYLETAKTHGDILVVGIDGDSKIRERKGEGRPVVPEDERMQALVHLRPVDLIYLKALSDPKWGLIMAVKPDVLIATQETYTAEQIEQLGEFCGDVVVLAPQAVTTTSARLRNIQLNYAGQLAEYLAGRVSEMIPAAVESFTKGELE
jgi:D-glycero-beta-D-manno-heptose 1-phosphate adenylyltransferase